MLIIAAWKRDPRSALAWNDGMSLHYDENYLSVLPKCQQSVKPASHGLQFSPFLTAYVSNGRIVKKAVIR